MLLNGVPMLTALEIARETIGNGAFKSNLVAVTSAVKEGKRLSEEIENQGLLPGMAGQLLRVGEESGALTTMLTHAADLLDAKARRAAKNAVEVIAPATTLLLGLLVAGIVVSVMSALLSINELV